MRHFGAALSDSVEVSLDLGAILEGGGRQRESVGQLGLGLGVLLVEICLSEHNF